jgi:ligand-binding sensor domain-containing protein
MRETHDAQIWIARSNIPAGEGPLCRVAGQELDSYGTKQDIPMRYVMNILEVPQGHLLIHSDDQVVEWDPRSLRGKLLTNVQFGADGVQNLAIDPDGSLLVGSVSGRLPWVIGPERRSFRSTAEADVRRACNCQCSRFTSIPTTTCALAVKAKAFTE